MRGFRFPILVWAVLFVSAVAGVGQGPGPTAGTPPTGAAAPSPSHVASLLISADGVYAWTLDGDLQGMTSADMHPKVVNVAKLGTHEIVITSPDGKIKLRQTVTVKANEQTVVHFTASSIVVNGGSIAIGAPRMPTSEELGNAEKVNKEISLRVARQYPEGFGGIQPPNATKGMPGQPSDKWTVTIMAAAVTGKYNPKLQMSAQDSSGKWKQLPDGQTGSIPSYYQVYADDLGAEIAVCYTANSDTFPEPMRETAWYTVHRNPQAPERQATFTAAKPPILEEASDKPCGGKGVAAADPTAKTNTPVAPSMADNPKYFGTIASGILRYKNQWRLNLVVQPWRPGTTYYDEQVQLTLKGVPGQAGPVHVTDLQPASLPGTYQVAIDNIGSEVVVCYTAKDPLRPTPMRMTTWYKVNSGDSAANLTPSREPTLVPASSAPCE